ncbi:hypothetical protein Fcan01_26735 [Folsomia candida]|uniref:SWIM-type domain-containing protein n=1 Tax=Folsomia candida TaxID=158441 RepID=A0A226D033_FOLCA|nr:hypothetical protein Fcan01_26735 [Folsomia candida]
MDFSKDSRLTNSDYEMLLGVSMDNFDVLLAHCQGSVRNSANRSVRNSLAIFLMKLRLNLSQRVIAFLFGILHQSTISETISSVLKSLLASFAPLYTGYGHKTRQELFDQHMRPFFTSILGVPPESLILILDGTYLFVEKSSSFHLQRRSFSNHKKRNLFKPMMSDSIMSLLEEDDVLILDRGFRDAIESAESQGLACFMPELLKKNQVQFTTTEANKSRLVTMLRWVVESVNGRLKNKFKFFEDIIYASYFPKLPGLLKVTVAILNAFSPPIFTQSPWHEDLIEYVASRLESPNLVQALVEQNNLQRGNAAWNTADEDDVLEFPELSLDELKLITLGPYQLNIGIQYNWQHAPSGGGYDFQLHKDMDDLLRIKLRSRFSRRPTHTVWIFFTPWGHGFESIRGWYCLCKSGSRTLGCCGHVAAVLRYLSYDRFLPIRSRRKLDSEGYLDATPNQEVPSSSQPGPSHGVSLVADVVELLEGADVNAAESSDDEEFSDED